MAGHRTSDGKYEDRFFDLLQDTIEGIDSKVDRLSSDLRNNTETARKASNNLTKLSDRLHEQSSKIERLEKAVFPDVPASAKDLPPWWRDPKIITLLTIGAAAIVVIGYVVAGVMGIKVPALP